MLNVRNCTEKTFKKTGKVAKDEKLSWDHDTHRIQCAYANKQTNTNSFLKNAKN